MLQGINRCNPDNIFIADNATSLVRNVILYLLENASQYDSEIDSIFLGQPFYEKIAALCILTNPQKRLLCSQNFPDFFNPGLAAARFFFLISGSNFLKNISFYTNGVKRFSDNGLNLMGSAVGNRIFSLNEKTDQFDKILHLIRNRKNTKRATISVYLPEDCSRVSRDVPCCISMTFSARNNSLCMTVVMRANNALRLLPYNIFEFSLFGEFVASCLDLRLDKYIHFVISMHMQADDEQVARSLLNENINTLSMVPMPRLNENFRRKLIHSEEEIRTTAISPHKDSLFKLYQSFCEDYDSYWLDILKVLVGQAIYRIHGLEIEKEFLAQKHEPSHIFSALLESYIQNSNKFYYKSP